jgi:hypothetical protein
MDGRQQLRLNVTRDALRVNVTVSATHRASRLRRLLFRHIATPTGLRQNAPIIRPPPQVGRFPNDFAMSFPGSSMFSPTSRLPRTMVTVWAACTLIAACNGNAAQPAQSTPVAATALDTAEIKRFDALVSPSAIFSDPSQRALYKAHAPSTDDGRRSYVFELTHQAGMTPNRHFHLITITWARAGTFVTSGGAPRSQSSTGGPNGGFVDAAAQTADKAYDVNVAEGMLLPDAVQVPDFDLAKAAAALVQSYNASAPRR